MISVIAASNDIITLNALRRLINGEGYTFVATHDLNHILETVRQHQSDIFILDTTTYEQDASIICRQFRNDAFVSNKSILLLTGAIDAHQAALLLDAGADDLVRKPFVDREFVARLRALQRWVKKENVQQKVRLQLIDKKNIVTVDHRQIYLTPIEFRLLRFLCDNRERYYAAADLLLKLWDYPPNIGDTALVRNHIRNLRRKLELDPDRPHILISRYGQGYTIHAAIVK